MKSPLCRIDSVGEISNWARQFLKGLQNENLAEVFFEGTTQKFCDQKSTSVSIVFIENAPDMKREILKLRSAARPLLVVWYGKIFTKEDLQFAIENRIYLTMENPRHDDKKTVEPLKRIARAAEAMQQTSHYVQSIQTLSIEGDQIVEAKSLFDDVKESAEKLERCLHLSNEFLHESKSKNGGEENRMALRANQDLRGALYTIHELERTGSLQVKGSFEDQTGKVDFIHGRLVSASTGSVRGLKAVYRMFLWDEPRYSFERMESNSVWFEGELNVNLKHLCVEGEAFRQKYGQIRKEIPPKEIQVELEPSALHPQLELTREEFSTLGSVVEFGDVGKVVDFNPLPDVTLYEGMISLRKNRIIRVVNG